MPDRISVERWWDKQRIPMLSKIVYWIYNEIKPRNNKHRTDYTDKSEVDEEWTNHFNFLQNVFPYVLLFDAIQYCDLGLLRLAMQLTLLMFAANTKSWIYQRELCYYNWLVNSAVAKDELQRAVLRESMINRAGHLDSYYSMDLANELLNLLITKAKTLRRTSALTVHKLLDRYTRTAHFLN